MYRIEITCTAAQAKAISELMLDLSFQSFAVHSVEGEGALPAPEAKAAKSSFRPLAKNRSLLAVILTAVAGRGWPVGKGNLTTEFTTAACEDMCRRIGLSPTTARAALSSSKRHGYVVQLGKGRFTLTDKGRKLANSPEFASIPLPEEKA